MTQVRMARHRRGGTCAGTVIVAATPLGEVGDDGEAGVAAVGQAQAFAHVLQADAGAAAVAR